MTPQEVAFILRRIAGAIDNSKRPSKDMVISDLETVIARMKTAEQQQGQQQQQALPKSMSGKNMLKKFLEDAQEALEREDDAGFKGALEKLQKAAV